MSQVNQFDILPTIYVTRDGDVVDEICKAQYGRTDVVTEAVLAANPGLADYGPYLPAGVSITLPVLKVAQQTQPDRLWD